MPTTEILVMSLIAGSDLGDPSNNAAKVAKESFDTLSKQDGLQQIHFGMQKENPSKFQGLITWDSLDAHKSFMASEQYPSFLKHFLAVVDGSPKIVHADYKPDGALAKTLAAPVTEVATFVFESEVPKTYEAGINTFAEAIEKAQPEGYLGAAYGFTYEEVEIDGEKGKAAALTIGWDSVDAHMKFRETQTFKDNIHYLREGVKKAEMYHVQFMNFVPS